MVTERVVLLRIQHFQKRGGGVTSEVGAQLVDLVKQNQRVICVDLPDGLNDAPGHGADIGAAVTSNFRFIADTPQRKTDILSAKRLGNGLGNGGLACSGRPYKAENRAFQRRVTLRFDEQLSDRQILHDAFFQFIKAIVVAIEDTARARQIMTFRIDAPERQF